MKRKITPFQKIVALTLTVALVVMMITPAFASYFVIAEYGVANINGRQQINFVHPSTGALELSATVQSFTGDGRYLSWFRVYLNKTGSPSGVMTSAVWNNSAGAPDKILENGTTLSIATLSTDLATWYEFTFSNTTLLTLGSTYYFGVYIENGTVSVANCVQLWVDASAPTGAGTLNNHFEGSWQASSTDMAYYLVTTDLMGEALPPDEIEWDLGTADTLLAKFAAFIVPVFVVLLPALLLMFLTRRADKWLLIIGIVIGAGLGNYFGIVPLWVVFLVTIGLIGMAYQSVRGGNS